MANDTEIGGLVVKMKADLSDYMQKLDKMEQTTVKTSDNVAKSFASISTIMAKTGAAAGAFATTAINSAMKWGNAVDDLGDKTGMAGEEASKLLVIAKRVGIGAEEANMMFSRFARSAYTAAQAQATAAAEGKDSSDAYSQLGISVLNADNTMKSASEIFGEVKDKIAAMPDGLQKTAMEMEFFGRSGAQMHDMLNMTTVEMQKVIDKARSMGLILSSEQAAAWEKFERDVNSTKGTLTSVGISIGNELMPQLQQLLGSVQSVTQAFTSLDPETRQNILSVVKLCAEIGIASKVINIAVGKIGGAAEALGIMRAATIAAAGPWVALAIAIAMATKALADNQAQANGGMVEGELNSWGVDLPPEVAPQATDTQLSEGARNRYKRNHPEPKQNQMPIVPNISSDDDKGPTAYEQYKKDTQDLISMWEKQVQLEQISYEDMAKNVQCRLDGLEAVNVLDKEIYDRDSLQAELQLKINESLKQAHDLAISRAEAELELGNITKQEYADIIAKQLESAVNYQEQVDLTVKFKKAQDDIRTSILETASQNVQLGNITLEQYIEILKQQQKLTKSDEDHLKLATQLAQVQYELISKEITNQERLTTIKKNALSKQEEDVRHNLKMIETFSDSSLAVKKSIWDAETALTKKNLTDQYNLEMQAYIEKINIYEKLKSENGKLTEQEQKDYEELLQQKTMLIEKYNLDMEKANNAYIEKIAVQQKAIIDANNNMIADLIDGTKSGHDILKNMWSDFIKQVVEKMFSIKTSMNVFTGLFGGIFGIDNSLDGTPKIAGKKASGGPVESGKTYLVGEKGPELFTAPYSGSIIPNSDITSGKISQVSSGQAVQYNISVPVTQNFQGAQDASVVAQIKDSLPYIKAEIRNAIRNETAMRSAIKGAAT